MHDMKRVEVQNRFKRDMRRMRKRGADRRKLEHIVDILMRGEILPVSARPHKLSGEWNGFWECHIESDWLLIYDVTDNAVLLAGTGSHADLFE